VSVRRVIEDVANDDAPRLHPADIEAIALRVVGLLQGQAAPAARLVDAAELASILSVERDWVYTHADDLHSVRLGGPRGRLRFDLAAVVADLNGDPGIGRPQRVAPRGTKLMQLGGELLPIDP
jgi:hypothetical protein